MLKPQNLFIIFIFQIQLFASIPVTVTSYCSNKHECSGNPFVTATGYHLTKKDKKVVVAVSRNLFKKFKNKKIKLKIGKTIHYVTVRDTMHPRWHNKVDIYYSTDIKGALKFGKRKGIISEI